MWINDRRIWCRIDYLRRIRLRLFSTMIIQLSVFYLSDKQRKVWQIKEILELQLMMQSLKCGNCNQTPD